jgi:hypothetical protein
MQVSVGSVLVDLEITADAAGKGPEPIHVAQLLERQVLKFTCFIYINTHTHTHIYIYIYIYIYIILFKLYGHTTGGAALGAPGTLIYLLY